MAYQPGFTLTTWTPSFPHVGKAFAENSSSTSLQRDEAQRVVGLLSSYFQKSFPHHNIRQNIH